MFKFNKNLIFIGLALLGIIITIVLIFTGSESGSVLSFLRFDSGISAESVAKKSIDYLNSSVLQQGQTATLVNFSEESGVVKVSLKIGDNTYDSYASKDGKLFFPEGLLVDGSSKDDQVQAKLDNVRQVTDQDHIRGSLQAPVKIVEYSDMECPFCKQFHLTLKKIVDEYGKDGKVAWVYRHFPLDQLHPKARKEAVASECAAELGGSEKFWGFIDRFYEITPSNNQTDIDKVLPQISKELSLDKEDFNSCIASDKYDVKIQDDIDNAQLTGGSGTPWSIVVSGNGKKYSIGGNQSYDDVKKLIETALSEK